MRALSFKKWSFLQKPQKNLCSLSVVLICMGMLLLSAPNRCQADDDPPADDAAAAGAADADAPPPPPTPKPEPAKPPQVPSPPPPPAQTKEVHPRALQSGGQRDTPEGLTEVGKCYQCSRIVQPVPPPNSPPDPNADTYECMDRNDVTNLRLVDCYQAKGPVRCMTYHVINKGTAKPVDKKLDKSEERRHNRIDGKGCLLGYKYKRDSNTGRNICKTDPKTMKQVCEAEVVDRAECARIHLYMKLADGKCFKGSYAKEAIRDFQICVLGDDGSAPSVPFIGDSTVDSKGKNELYWDLMGGTQYVDLTICSCSDKDKCNAESTKTKKFKDAAQASGAGLLGSFGFATLITSSMAIVTLLYLK